MTTILGIWAHPDDEVFVSGGLMADTVRRGDDSFAPPLNEFDIFWPGHPTVAPYSDVILNLTDELLAVKVEALRQHASQMKPLFDAYGDDFMRGMAAREHFRLAPTHPSWSNLNSTFSFST
jgi:LmbE family N-acetylglucosaminyl deacetylase